MTPVPMSAHPPVELNRRWAYAHALIQPNYEDLPCPSSNQGRSLKTQPSTPTLPQAELYNDDFYKQVYNKLNSLAIYSRNREDTYGPAIRQWIPGREPSEIRKELLEKRYQQEHEWTIWINSLPDTDEEEDEKIKQERKLRSCRDRLQRKRKHDDDLPESSSKRRPPAVCSVSI